MDLSINKAEVYEGLPFVWRGQEIKQIGPIEPLPQQVQHKLANSKGLQWVPFYVTNVTNDLVNDHAPNSAIRKLA